VSRRTRHGLLLCGALGALGLLGAVAFCVPQRLAVSDTAPAAATARPPTPGPGQFANPVIDRDFPDPDVLRVGDTYYAYATNAGGKNVQVARSRDLVRWEALPDALPALPTWSRPGRTWAPEVAAAAGAYVLYFAARHEASGRQCVGAATSPAPQGPFRPVGEEPLICQLDQGGSIDASAFADEDGSRYVLWKNDGNCCGLPTWISIQAASEDGLRLEGAPVQLIRGDQPWEGSLVEAPTLWKRGGRYYLFYSANRYGGAGYAVGYAVADSPLGPFRKAPGPLLATSTSRGPVVGPGGQDVVEAKNGSTWLLYHAWAPKTPRYRGLSVDELAWEGERPVVRGSTGVPVEAPHG